MSRLIQRRLVLKSLIAGLGLTMPVVSYAKLDALLGDHYGDSDIKSERVEITIPSLAENGNSVPFRLAYSGTEPAFNIKVFAPANPEPLLVEFDFAAPQESFEVNTRIRLANSQTLMAVVETKSGTLYAATAETVITLAACVEPLL